MNIDDAVVATPSPKPRRATFDTTTLNGSPSKKRKTNVGVMKGAWTDRYEGGRTNRHAAGATTLDDVRSQPKSRRAAARGAQKSKEILEAATADGERVPLTDDSEDDWGLRRRRLRDDTDDEAEELESDEELIDVDD